MRPHYRIVGIDQGTSEWLDWRDNAIGSSDAPVIMGESPWKRDEDLLAEKLGEVERFRGNDATRRGTELEPLARRLYEKLTGNCVEPAVLQSTTYSWQVASVDGLADDGSVIVEIKCGKGTYQYTARTGRVPPYYVGQLQHILAVTGLPEIHFFCHWPGEDDLLLTVERDDSYIDRLHQRELKFWKKLTSQRNNLPETAVGDEVEKEGEEQDEEEERMEAVRLLAKHFESVDEAAEYFGVRTGTIVNWLHWLKFMPPRDRKLLVREIEIRRLDYVNGVIGTEEEEEEEAERRKRKIALLDEYFDTVAEIAEKYGVRESTIKNWVGWLKTLPTEERKTLVRQIERRGRDYAKGLIGTEDEEDIREVEKRELRKRKERLRTEAKKKQGDRKRQKKTEAREREQRNRLKAKEAQEAARLRAKIATERERRKLQRAKEAEEAAERRERKSLGSGAAVTCPKCNWLQWSAKTQVGKRNCRMCGHRW